MPLHGHACVSHPRSCPSALPTLKQQVRSYGTWRPLHLTPPSPTPPSTDIAAGTAVRSIVSHARLGLDGINFAAKLC